MMDFSTLESLIIPEGEVVQIEDASGNIIWMIQSEEGGSAIILEVEKNTRDTYVGSTSHTSEKFLLLDIYPKTANSTINVTYGGLTKTLTFSDTYVQQVYFGTFGGVSDEVETPDSGILTIEGDCIGVGCGTYNESKSATVYLSCITGVVDFGGVQMIPDNAFLTCRNLQNVSISADVSSIGWRAFLGCSSLQYATFSNTSGWYVTETLNGDISTGTAVDVSDSTNNAYLLHTTYSNHYWYRL